MKSSLENLLSDQLNGLLLPPDDGITSWIVMFVLGLLIVALGFIIGRWKHLRNSRVAVAKRELNRLERSKNVEQQVIQLASVLRKGLNVARLDEYKPKNLSAWKAFQTKLDVACYSNDNPTSQEIQTLFKQASVWLQE
ncbi:MAG: hypothetical protein V3U78_10075 [Thiotrichaceae bacterium]